MQKLHVNGTQVIRSATLTLGNGTYDDLALPAKSFIMFTGYTSDITIRGFAGGTDGLIIYIHNYSDKKIKLKHLDSNSATENQLILRGNEDRDIDKNMIGSFIYNGQINKWVLMSEH